MHGFRFLPPCLVPLLLAGLGAAALGQTSSPTAHQSGTQAPATPAPHAPSQALNPAGAAAANPLRIAQATVPATALPTPTVAPGSAGRVLFVLASSKVHGRSSLPASISFGEVVHAWDVFQAAGYAVDFVSPEGGAVPILDTYVSQEVAHRRQDDRIMSGLRNTARPAQIDPAQYRSVYFVGGSNAMYGVPENPHLQQIALHVYERNGGVVSAVCHGTAGIVNIKRADGRHLIAGKRITGYPEEHENQTAAYFKELPFLMRKTIEARGATFLARDGNQPYVEVDGRVVTGQNYLSAKPVAQAVVELLHQAGPAGALVQNPEYEAVDQAMRQTLRAFASSDAALFKQLLRPDGMVLGYSRTRGQMVMESFEEWSKGLTGTSAPDEAQRKRSYQILDISGHAALVRLNLDYPTWLGVDYLALSKIDGEWRIVTKAWSGQRKPPVQSAG